MIERIQPFVGVWWMDPEQSSFPAPLVVPKWATRTLLVHGDGLFHHVRAVNDDVEEIGWPSWFEPGPITSELVGETLVTTMRAEGVVKQVEHLSIQGGQLVAEREMHEVDGVARAVYSRTSTKQVLLYRRDLKMRKGKIAAQCAHASMAVYFRRNTGDTREVRVPLDGPMADWTARRFTKICLSVEDEHALLTAHDEAVRAGLPVALITDSGKTEFGGVPTRTALAIGPAAVPEIDRITGRGGVVDCKLA